QQAAPNPKTASRSPDRARPGSHPAPPRSPPGPRPPPRAPSGRWPGRPAPPPPPSRPPPAGPPAGRGRPTPGCPGPQGSGPPFRAPGPPPSPRCPAPPPGPGPPGPPPGSGCPRPAGRAPPPPGRPGRPPGRWAWRREPRLSGHRPGPPGGGAGPPRPPTGGPPPPGPGGSGAPGGTPPGPAGPPGPPAGRWRGSAPRAPTPRPGMGLRCRLGTSGWGRAWKATRLLVVHQAPLGGGHPFHPRVHACRLVPGPGDGLEGRLHHVVPVLPLQLVDVEGEAAPGGQGPEELGHQLGLHGPQPGPLQGQAADQVRPARQVHHRPDQGLIHGDGRLAEPPDPPALPHGPAEGLPKAEAHI